eukprot:scaffold1072_cov118-Isochrysis_galbana.AAC.5
MVRLRKVLDGRVLALATEGRPEGLRLRALRHHLKLAALLEDGGHRLGRRDLGLVRAGARPEVGRGRGQLDETVARVERGRHLGHLHGARAGRAAVPLDVIQCHPILVV